MNPFKPMKLSYTTFLLGYIFFLNISFAQSDFGIGLQAYPTGLIPGIELDTKIEEASMVHFRIGYNWIRHRDLGVHDDERGGGWGFSLGYVKYLYKEMTGLSIKAKTDMWWNHLDWEDKDPINNGMTDILVLQPTIALEYLKLSQNNVYIRPNIAFGWEWNIKTEGEPTGQGAILLVGLSIGLRK